jgi:hypothetical protein
MRQIARLWAFLRGDLRAAENMGDLPAVPPVAWITHAATDEQLAQYALEAARRSAEDAQAAVKGIQDRAASLLTLLIGLVPLMIAAIALTSPPSGAPVGRLGALVLYSGAGLMLVAGIVMAALSTGLTLGGGLNLSRLGRSGGSALAALKAEEADAWHYAAVLAMESATRKASDLFRARQLMLWALTFAIVGTIVLGVSVGGDFGSLQPDPSPVASPTAS